MKRDDVILVRGGGDLATGTIHRLWSAGLKVLVLEAEHPAAIRRQVSVSEAVYEGGAVVEGMRAALVKKLDEADGTYDIVGDLKRKLESSEAVLRRFFTFQVARYAISTLMAMALVVMFLLQLRIWKQAGFFISI